MAEFLAWPGDSAGGILPAGDAAAGKPLGRVLAKSVHEPCEIVSFLLIRGTFVGHPGPPRRGVLLPPVGLRLSLAAWGPGVRRGSRFSGAHPFPGCGVPGFGAKAALFQPRGQRREVLAQVPGQALIGGVHGDPQLAAAVFYAHFHAAFSGA